MRMDLAFAEAIETLPNPKDRIGQEIIVPWVQDTGALGEFRFIGKELEVETEDYKGSAYVWTHDGEIILDDWYFSERSKLQ